MPRRYQDKINLYILTDSRLCHLSCFLHTAWFRHDGFPESVCRANAKRQGADCPCRTVSSHLWYDALFLKFSVYLQKCHHLSFSPNCRFRGDRLRGSRRMDRCTAAECGCLLGYDTLILTFTSFLSTSLSICHLKPCSFIISSTMVSPIPFPA